MLKKECATASTQWPPNLWDYLEQNQGGATFNDLVKEIRSNFEVSDGELETDIAAHLEKLENMGLVRRSGRVA